MQFEKIFVSDCTRLKFETGIYICFSVFSSSHKIKTSFPPLVFSWMADSWQDSPPDGSRLVRLNDSVSGSKEPVHSPTSRSLSSHRLRPDCRRPVCMPTYSDARMARVHLDSAVGRALALQPSPNGLTSALPHTSVHHHLPNVPIGTSSIPSNSCFRKPLLPPTSMHPRASALWLKLDEACEHTFPSLGRLGMLSRCGVPL